VTMPIFRLLLMAYWLGAVMYSGPPATARGSGSFQPLREQTLPLPVMPEHLQTAARDSAVLLRFKFVYSPQEQSLCC
jgi:hypothetical protein